LAPIEDFVSRGGQLIWTIHEPLPHDCLYPAVEIELRQRLGELADAIHILHPSTLAEAQPYYDIPRDKVFVVEHPTYHGAYDDYVPRAAARSWLGIPDGAVLILAFGTIRPYKGFDRIVRLLPEIRRRSGRDVQVLICGSMLSDDDSTEVRELVAATPGAWIADTGIPGPAVHILFRAADLAVLPYRAVLNSGVLMLSLTFGVPTIAPRNAVTEDAAASGLLHLFSPESDAALMEVTLDAIALERTPPVATPDQWLARHAPPPIAGDFAMRLRQIRTQFVERNGHRP
jgi:glycosyltransferase involved in cell wall biosynthesis